MMIRSWSARMLDVFVAFQLTNAKLESNRINIMQPASHKRYSVKGWQNDEEKYQNSLQIHRRKKLQALSVQGFMYVFCAGKTRPRTLQDLPRGREVGEAGHGRPHKTAGLWSIR